MNKRQGFVPILLIVLALVVSVGGVGIGLAWKTDVFDKWLPPNIKELFGRGEKNDGVGTEGIKKLAFLKGGQVWIVNKDGTGLTQLTRVSGEIGEFHFSPDGKFLGYVLEKEFVPESQVKLGYEVRELELSTGQERILVKSLDNSVIVEIAKLWDSFAIGLNGFSYFPDGSKIIFSRMGVWTLDRSTGETRKLLSGTSPKEIDIIDESRAVYGDFINWSPSGNKVLITKFKYGGTVDVVLDLIDGSETSVSLRGVGGTYAIDFSDNDTLLVLSVDAGPSEEAIYTAPIQAMDKQSVIYRTTIEDLSSIALAKNSGRVIFSATSNLEFSQTNEEVPPPKLKDNTLYSVNLDGSDLQQQVDLGYDPENRLGIYLISVGSGDEEITFYVDYSPSGVSDNDELRILDLEAGSHDLLARGKIVQIEWVTISE